MAWLRKKADCEDCGPAGKDLMHGGLVDDGRLGDYETPKDAACPECGAGFDDIKRNETPGGRWEGPKPLTTHPQLECKRCGHRWSLFPKQV